MKRSSFVCLVCLVGSLVAACGSSRPEPEQPAGQLTGADELVARNIAARGGREKIKWVQSLVWSGHVSTMGMNMPITLYMKRPNLVRSEVTVQGADVDVISGFDGTTAWLVNPIMGPEPQELPESQAALQRDNTHIDGMLVDYKARGFTVQYVGDEEVRGTQTHKLRVIRPGLSDVYVYLDPRTFLEVRQDGESFDTTGRTTLTATYMDDYRDIGGLMIPFSLEVASGGQTVQKVTLNSVKVNAPVPDSLFAMPAL